MSVALWINPNPKTSKPKELVVNELAQILQCHTNLTALNLPYTTQKVPQTVFNGAPNLFTFAYQNLKSSGSIVYQYVLGHAGFLPLAASLLGCLLVVF